MPALPALGALNGRLGLFGLVHLVVVTCGGHFISFLFVAAHEVCEVLVQTKIYTCIDKLGYFLLLCCLLAVAPSMPVCAIVQVQLTGDC